MCGSLSILWHCLSLGLDEKKSYYLKLNLENVNTAGFTDHLLILIKEEHLWLIWMFYSLLHVIISSIFFFLGLDNIYIEVVIRKIISFHWLSLQILIGRH